MYHDKNPITLKYRCAYSQCRGLTVGVIILVVNGFCEVFERYSYEHLVRTG